MTFIGGMDDNRAMPFRRPVTEIIPVRSSRRTYLERPLGPETGAALRAALAAPPAAPFGRQVRLMLLESFDEKKRGGEKLGTYGFIKGAQNFLVGLVAEGEHSLEDFGYVFEWAVLVATDLGLATCWVGGTLKRGAFARAAGAGSDEIVPAVSPVGESPPKRRVFDSTIRLLAGATKRKPWTELFYTGDFGDCLAGNDAGRFGTVLEMTRLAPSASNRQPWRVVKQRDAERYHFYLKRTPGYRNMTSVDLQRIDMGIAMCHFALCADELGLPGRWDFEQPDIGKLPKGTEYISSWIVS